MILLRETIFLFLIPLTTIIRYRKDVFFLNLLLENTLLNKLPLMHFYISLQIIVIKYKGMFVASLEEVSSCSNHDDEILKGKISSGCQYFITLLESWIKFFHYTNRNIFRFGFRAQHCKTLQTIFQMHIRFLRVAKNSLPILYFWWSSDPTRPRGRSITCFWLWRR